MGHNDKKKGQRGPDCMNSECVFIFWRTSFINKAAKTLCVIYLWLRVQHGCPAKNAKLASIAQKEAQKCLHCINNERVFIFGIAQACSTLRLPACPWHTYCRCPCCCKFRHFDSGYKLWQWVHLTTTIDQNNLWLHFVSTPCPPLSVAPRS